MEQLKSLPKSLRAYTTDINTIEEYLKTNYITVSADQDVLTKIPAGGTQESIWDQNT
jgi:hypothetical protein